MIRSIWTERRHAVPRPIRNAWSRLGAANRWVALWTGVFGLAGLIMVYLALPPTAPPESLTVGLWQAPPFMSLNEKGEAAGAIPELLNAAAARAGVKLHWVLHPQGADSAMTPGSGIDLWPLVEITEARRKRFYITQPYARGDVLLVRLERDADRPIRTLGLRNWPEIRRWAQRTHSGARLVLRVDGSGLLPLCEGVLDATAVETPYFDAFLMKRPATCLNARFQVTPLEGFGTNYGIASTFPAQESADLLRHYLGEMAREGALDDIFYRYYPLAHYRSAESFAETSTEKSFRLLRWSASALFVTCVLFWIAIQRFRRKAAETLAMSDLRSRFLARISHEFRTPLNGVLGIASVLSSTDLDRTQREYVGLIRSSGETLLRTVNEVLDFSRLEAGKHSLAYAPVRMEHLVEEVISILAPVAFQKNLELVWTVDPDVPAAFQSDATALRQILMNLLGNALKFTERGHVALEIRHMALDPSTAYLRILVSDTGPGIPAGQEEEIFNPYARGGSASTQAQVGTGLGLSITRQLAILLGGSVRVANNPTGGCTFTAELPVTPVPGSFESATSWCSGVRLPEHILLLTRRAITGDMLERRLRAAGCRVTRPPGTESAQTLAEIADPCDLLVIDADIEGDVLALAKTLQRSQPGSAAPVILLATGKLAADDLGSHLPESYLVFPKPFLSALFASALERLANPPGPPKTLPLHGSETHTSPRKPEDPASGLRSGLPPGLPPSLIELYRATQLPATLSPDCVPEAQRCDACSRDLSKCFEEYAAASLPLTNTPKVLVADDNPVNLKVVSSFLRAMGFSCETATTGNEALDCFARTEYSWIIMDWHMPEMDGLAAIEKIRDRERRHLLPRTPIILCTATNARDARLAAEGDTFDEALSKPISLKSLQIALIVSASRAHGPLWARKYFSPANPSHHPPATPAE